MYRLSTTPAFSTRSTIRAAILVGDDAEPVRVRDLLDEDLRPVGAGREPLDGVVLRVFEDVVAEADDEPVVPREALGHPTTCATAPGSACTLYVSRVEQHVAPVPLAHPSVTEQVDEIAAWRFP